MYPLECPHSPAQKQEQDDKEQSVVPEELVQVWYQPTLLTKIR